MQVVAKMAFSHMPEKARKGKKLVSIPGLLLYTKPVRVW